MKRWLVQGEGFNGHTYTHVSTFARCWTHRGARRRAAHLNKWEATGLAFTWHYWVEKR